MKKRNVIIKNNKGFTLIELIATIVILALVMGISTYSISVIINNSKEKNYELLIKNIEDSLESYYQECKYVFDSDDDKCQIKRLNNADVFETTLGNLIDYGFLKGNSTDDKGKSTLVNPKDEVNISECIVRCQYSQKKFQCDSALNIDSCPEIH